MNYKSFFILGFPENYLKYFLDNIEQIYRNRQCFTTYKSKFEIIKLNLIILTTKLFHLVLICFIPMSSLVRVINYDVMFFLNCSSKINFIQIGCLMQCLYMYYILYIHNYSKKYSVFSLLLIKRVLYENNCHFFLCRKLNAKSSQTVEQLIRKYISLFMKLFEYCVVVVGWLKYFSVFLR